MLAISLLETNARDKEIRKARREKEKERAKGREHTIKQKGRIRSKCARARVRFVQTCSPSCDYIRI